MKVDKADRNILKDIDTCPFCKTAPDGVVMPGHLGFCAMIQCISTKCLVNPSTHMFESKTKKGALTKARKAWEGRRKKNQQ